MGSVVIAVVYGIFLVFLVTWSVEGMRDQTSQAKDVYFLHRQFSADSYAAEPIRNRIERISQDIGDIKAFYSSAVSPSRLTRTVNYLKDELSSLESAPFSYYSQDNKVDYLLLRNYLQLSLRNTEHAADRDAKIAPIILPFASTLINLLERRQRVDRIEPQKIAQRVHDTVLQITQLTQQLSDATSDTFKELSKIDMNTAYHAADRVNGLRENMVDWFSFYKEYDPLFTWWVTEPHDRLNRSMAALASVIRDKLVGIKPDDKDAIVGQPIGRKGLLHELEAEVIAYTPEELIEIGESEYRWCEMEMKRASLDLGFGDDWHGALDYVKGMYVPPGEQIYFVRDLIREGTEYVQQHDLVSVPPLAAECWRMFMLSPDEQKTNPFFLGGPDVMVSYPMSTMPHHLKLQSMRGNNRPMARAVAFHEMIPGHHLQLFVGDRSRPYRRLFSTPFFVEGWALYWEMQFWNRGDFFTTPADKVGTLFWRMHRCIRIVFSLQFHLGQITPQQAIDMLVDRVGHERATAEGEVRRSLNGDYSPLYQAGYLLGALELMELRKETVETGLLEEKKFHDTILRANTMPIELLRALIGNHDLAPDYTPSWKFYGNRTVPAEV